MIKNHFCLNKVNSQMLHNIILRALRRMASRGEIPVIRIASKRLINLDLLLDILSCYNNDAA